FTGAIARKKGRFMAANRGTILLDEISEMGVHLQAKLLRVLQEREVEPLGSDRPEKVNVRVLATSNQNLEEMVRKGEFREDLFYRLNVVPIFLPPLRDRKEDIPLLTQYFVDRICALNNLPPREIEEEVFSYLQSFDWPGNVRQLEHVIERVLVYHKRAELLRLSHFRFVEKELGQMAPRRNQRLAGRNLRELEKQAILDTLAQFRGNRTKTAEVLGIAVRTLRNKLREYRENNEVPEEYTQWVYEQKD
ncbi:MAG: sigma-54-dependent Fis family transcriptional regulator, partial [Calditrichaeota bacterium]